MSKILASIADAELGSARYVSTANRGEILERATAARAEHAEIVAFLEASRRTHDEVDMDTYYSCAKTPEWNGCNDPKEEAKPWQERTCTCGADAYNARLDTLLSRIAPERAP